MLNGPLVDIQQAEHLLRRAHHFTVRLVYDGPNAANASGRSFKYWQTVWSGAGDAVISWGRIGAAGQSQRKPVDGAIDRAHTKLNKGYAYDAGTGVLASKESERRLDRAPRPVLTFAERIARSALSVTTLDGVLEASALHGWVPFDVGGLDLGRQLADQRLMVGFDGRLYVDRQARCWIAGREGSGRWMFGQLHAGGSV